MLFVQTRIFAFVAFTYSSNLFATLTKMFEVYDYERERLQLICYALFVFVTLTKLHNNAMFNNA